LGSGQLYAAVITAIRLLWETCKKKVLESTGALLLNVSANITVSKVIPAIESQEPKTIE
jgi:hypothetical protein